MQRYHEDKPGLHRGDWSSAVDRSGRFGGYGIANVAVFALVGLTLDALGLALMTFDTAAFERYCRVVDGSGAAAVVQLLVCFGPAALLLVDHLRLGAGASSRLGWQRRWLLALDGLALVYLVFYIIMLRGPWLVEHASAHSRLDVWSAQLSETVSGVPFAAFFHVVGFGVLFIATSSAALQAFSLAGYLQTPPLLRRFTGAVRVLCAVDFIFVMIAFVTCATGSLL